MFGKIVIFCFMESREIKEDGGGKREKENKKPRKSRKTLKGIE